jgi:3-deoxy-7-phosphoheptulonate synthase
MRDVSTLDLFEKYDIDVIQIGARNMQNFEILRRAGEAGRPVLLKRGPANSIDEWLQAAEYILLNGNPNVILCERGIVPPAGAKTRYLLDISAIPVVRHLTHLPVIADPSHASGVREYVPPLARAVVAAGAHGLLVEVHCAPDHALCDGPQSLTPPMLEDLVREMRAHGFRLGRAGAGSSSDVLRPVSGGIR